MVLVASGYRTAVHWPPTYLPRAIAGLTGHIMTFRGDVVLGGQFVRPLPRDESRAAPPASTEDSGRQCSGGSVADMMAKMTIGLHFPLGMITSDSAPAPSRLQRPQLTHPVPVRYRYLPPCSLNCLLSLSHRKRI
jgi:hypothetical protein